MAKKTISNSFTVTTLVDGESTFDVTLDNQIAGVECDKSGDIVGDINISFRISAHYGSNDVINACTITDNHEDVDSDIDVSYSQQQKGLVTLYLNDGNALRDTNVIAFTVVHPQYGTRVVSFTIKRIINGESAPFYNEEWYAWSNVASTANTTTSPFTEPYAGWQKYIPEQGGLAYLWQKLVRYNFNESTKEYVAATPQYFRMSGTNGTSIHTRGEVANASKRGNGTANIILDNGTEQQITLSDGDAVTQLDNGHLYQWVTESGGKWLDLGQFKGENGKTYYTHIVWATNVVSSSMGITRIEGYVAEKDPNDTTHFWMGTYVDETATDPSSGSDAILKQYSWTNTKGEATLYSIQSNRESVKILSNQTSLSTSVTFNFFTKVGDAERTDFNTYFSIYTVADNGVYQRVNPSSSTPSQNTSVTQSFNLTTSHRAIAVFIWGTSYSSAYVGNYPNNQPYLAKKEIPILKDGDTGQDGERGKVGRFYYFAESFNAQDSTTQFVVNDVQVPYFEHLVDGQKRYHVFNPEETPASGYMTMAQMWAASEQSWNNAPWEVMTNDFKYIITEAMFAEYARLSSFVITGDLMFSLQGRWGDLYTNQDGDNLVAHTLIGVNSSGVITGESASSTIYTFIDAANPEKITEVKVGEINGSFTTQAAGEVETLVQNVSFETGKMYSIHHSLEGCRIYLRYKITSSSFNDFLLNTSLQGTVLFMVKDNISFDIIVKSTAAGTATYSVNADERYFSPNVTIDGYSGKVVLNDVLSRGTFNGIARLTSLSVFYEKDEDEKRGDANFGGVTTITQPIFPPDKTGDTSRDDAAKAKMPRIPFYKKVVVLEKNSYGVEYEKDYGTLTIEPNTGYLKFTSFN